MPELSEGPNSFGNPEAGQGGADAVNDTPTEAGHGAGIEESVTGAARARVRPGSGVPVLGWALLALVVLVLVVFLLGIF